MQIHQHPVFGDSDQEDVSFYFEGERLTAKQGQKVSSALMANQIYELGRSRKLNQPRGVYCGLGRCMNCYVTIGAKHHVRACKVNVTEGMQIYKNG